MSRWGAAMAAGLLVALSACAGPSELDSAVRVSVFETRFDAALGQVQVRVENTSPTTVTVLSARLTTTLYPDAGGFERAQSVPASGARDLPVALGEAACDAEPHPVSVDLRLADESGATRDLVIPVTDDRILAAAHERDCRVQAVATHAEIAPPQSLAWSPGSARPATVTFTVTPTGAAGWLSIRSVGPTTLLGIVDETGRRATPLIVDRTVDGTSEPSVLTVRIVPARCDAHAIAEDKQGTLFPFDIATSESVAGQVRIAVPDAVRQEIYDFVTDYCATAPETVP